MSFYSAPILQKIAILKKKTTQFFDFKFFRLYKTLPDGWFSYDKSKALYKEALKTSGSILEIGSFVGRSTASICYGIRDSRVKKEFYSIDLHFQSSDEFKCWYEPIHGKINALPELFTKYMQNGGTLHHLKKNLADLRILDYVHILKGDFNEVVPPMKFSLIFCDATHDLSEIRFNLPKLTRFMQKGTVLLCDDIRTEELFEEVKKQISFSESTIICPGLFKGIV